MERILIIGCPGSGKTTLSRELGEKLDLPVTHLDNIFWSPGNWVHLDNDAFDEALGKELQKQRWIIEGNFDRTLPWRLEFCDTVIWMDYSRWVCLWGWIKRMVFNWGKVRSDMAPGCVERWDWEFAAYIWNFRKNKSSKNEALFAGNTDKKVYRFKSRRATKRFLKTL